MVVGAIKNNVRLNEVLLSSPKRNLPTICLMNCAKHYGAFLSILQQIKVAITALLAGTGITRRITGSGAGRVCSRYRGAVTATIYQTL